MQDEIGDGDRYILLNLCQFVPDYSLSACGASVKFSVIIYCMRKESASCKPFAT